MNTLHVYPTSRALRQVSHRYKEEEGLLPTLMRMDIFEERVILLDNLMIVDPLQRILFLRKAATFESFKGLHFDPSVIQFFTKSDAIFKFFEELAAERVGFDDLVQADAYAEFEEHLVVLERLLENYHTLLQKEGLTDKAFIPQSYRINKAFLANYQVIEIHLEGYLSLYELSLLEEISKEISLNIHYTTSVFNLKMQRRFEQSGILLPNNSHLSFSLTQKEILHQEQNTKALDVKVYAVEQRLEQVAVAFAQIEKMVASGVAPEEIVLVLPDETAKVHYMLFDRYNNLNFAMGYDYSRGRVYQSLEMLYRYWQRFEKQERDTIERYGMDLEKIDALGQKQCGVDTFFEALKHLALHQESTHEEVYEAALHFRQILARVKLSLKEWLFLWLKRLSKITMDDVRGGKVTVMGLLETRGVCFEGVVIVDFNEGIVPATTSKDQFLNSSVRAFANLPTKHDREALQKQYYKRLLEQAKQGVILYSSSDNALPSKFLFELGLEKVNSISGQLDLLYTESQALVAQGDPIVEPFVAEDIRWSASRLKTYLECKRKYYYRYVQKIAPKQEETLNEGAFLHRLLEALYEVQTSYLSIKEMDKAIAVLMQQLLPFDDAKTRYQKRLWQQKLQAFIAQQVAHFESGWRVVEREKEFHGTIGGLRFKGRIDRIDQNATETLVLDYKSGSVSEAQKRKNIETLTDLQMSIYAEILKPHYPHLTLGFVKLFDKGEIEEITLLEAKTERLAEVIVALKQTERLVAEKTEVLQRCLHCEFALMCERGVYG